MNTYTAEEVEQVADVLHSIQCRWNHIDGCAYYYGPSHRLEALKSYMPQAEKMLAANDFATVMSVLDSMRK